MTTDSRSARLYKILLPIATGLALVVVVLGAWVRLTDAGLGCPDWPGCYGTLTVPEGAEAIQQATEAYPERPVETGKAWKEMIHRYFAGGLGLLVLAIVLSAWFNRRQPGQQVFWPIALGGLIVFQALLGMWTVTLLLKPVIVMAHLLGGMATLSLLFWLTIKAWRRSAPQPARNGFTRFALIGLIALVCQIALGGWTSANYAALACPDFPTCQAQWWPEMDLKEGFVMWRGLGVDYEGGVLDNTARVAIHVVHRVGAVVVTLLLGLLALWLMLKNPARQVKGAALLSLVALAIQVSIGIGVVQLSLPLGLATSHNAGAALLLLALVNLNHRVRHVDY